eukprot:CAMPEP_0113867902 /NCGR_PEP_ID=MMETSP0780_2-20120614/683_1 /TAXON_ID=652834 /ORGANISM="Palpitomonas bilix" /LENGTH=133 /DNA_ID=CAMNT_0000852909 /DNA_START=322 /DNA_END=723 /DNA_ORIENTATION=+ /assembly_acc=CAM_ASM_000599
MTKKQTRKDHSNSQKLLPSSAKIKKPKKVLKKDAKAVGSQCVASVEEKSTFLDDLFKTASSKPTEKEVKVITKKKTKKDLESERESFLSGGSGKKIGKQIDGLHIVTDEELKSMLTGGEHGGECPFDCDCCYI